MLTRSATTSPSKGQMTGRVPYRATGPPALPKSQVCVTSNGTYCRKRNYGVSLVAICLFLFTYAHIHSHMLKHMLTHPGTQAYLYVRIYTRAYTFTCTHSRAHTILCPQMQLKLIFCFEDCFLNQIKAFQPTKKQRPSALESGRQNQSKRTQAQGVLG